MTKSGNPFEPALPLAEFDRPEQEFQVNVDPVADTVGLDGSVVTDDQSQRSFRWPSFLFLVLLVGLTFRLVNLQVTNGQIFQGLAKGNRIETRRTLPPRGLIVDRRGQPLVFNQPIYELNLYPAQLPRERADREQIYRSIESETEIKAADIIVEVDKRGLRSIEPITLKPSLPRETALLWQMRLGNLPGLAIEIEPIRAYQGDLALAHAIGYVGKVTADELAARPDLRLTSIIGKSGLEQSYDRQLQGKEGRQEIEVDAQGQIQRIVSSEPALPGRTLKLHLDKDLQTVMARALNEGAKKAGRRKGVAIALDPQSGGVLGFVSLPSYDNNLFVQPDKKAERQSLFDDPDQPLFNRAIAGLYPPGSTSKPIWALAGLREGLINERTNIETPAEIKVGNSTFPDWKYHGNADVKKAIAESNNIFFYAVAGGYDRIKGLGPEKMKEYATRFGWGETTGIDIKGEAKGIYPDPEWKKKRLKLPWYIGDTYHAGIGQGYVSVTPLQLLRSIAAIANGGTLYAPRFVREVLDLDGKTVEQYPSVAKSVELASADHFRIVREGMRQTVLEGTARPLNEIAMPIAAKTGTAQFEDRDKTHAWFVGFAPFDKPTIALLVMVEGGGESFSVAVPIAKEILSWYSNERP